MNYLAHLRGFKLRRAEYPLNTQEITLYYILCEYMNELYFPKSFTAANSVLQGLTGLSLSGLKRARSALQRKGYIHYQNGHANQAGRYALVSLENYGRAAEDGRAKENAVQKKTSAARPQKQCMQKTAEVRAEQGANVQLEHQLNPPFLSHAEPHLELLFEPQSGPQSEPQDGRQADRTPDTLYKQNKKKEKETKEKTADCFQQDKKTLIMQEEMEAFRKKYPNFSEDQIWYLARRLKQKNNQEGRETADVCRS